MVLAIGCLLAALLNLGIGIWNAVMGDRWIMFASDLLLMAGFATSSVHYFKVAL